VLRTTLLAPGVEDAAGWDLTLGGLDLFGLAAEQAAHLLCALSAVMMIGNVTFTAPFTAKDQCCEATPSSGVEMVAQLLQVELRTLTHSLTHRTISSGRGSSYTLPLTSSQCNDARDALSRAVYAGLFELLIARLNEHMANLGGATVDDESELFVGLLDV
jgi:myosin heavy subunit